MNQKTFLLLMVTIGLIISLSACGPSAEPTAPIAPITIGEDLTSIDVCQAIPQEDIETVMGVKLIQTPTRYTLRNADGTSGCFYKAQTDSDREQHFGYVILTPLDVYDNHQMKEVADVSDIGDAAHFTSGSDARQLWVKIDNKVAFVVAFGDVAREEGAKAIAKLMVEAIK
jgi:hypothetical protein